MKGETTHVAVDLSEDAAVIVRRFMEDNGVSVGDALSGLIVDFCAPCLSCEKHVVIR